MTAPPPTPRSRFAGFVLAGVLLHVTGCGGGGEPDLIWGKRGVRDGDLARPRAIAILPDDRLYLVDFTARIQAYNLDGNYVGPTWTTPDFRNGRPGGLGVTRDGDLIVCDSHYHTVRIYASDGREQWSFGEEMFGYISDAVQDADGFFYVSEYGDNERINKHDAEGNWLASWGHFGDGPGEFNRLRALALGPDGLLYVADACNHRIQVFTRDGEFVRQWGEPGTALGAMKYPYDLSFSPDGKLYVIEYGNHRVQKFTTTGDPLGTWGGPGRGPGGLHAPWGLAVDRHGRVHVVDSMNHRIQRVEF